MSNNQSNYDMPREKIAMQTARSLSSVELVQVVIGSGGVNARVSRLAKRCLKLMKEKGSEIGYSDLLNIAGIGPANASRIVAALELSRRTLFDVGEARKQDLIFVPTNGRYVTYRTSRRSGERITEMSVPYSGHMRPILKLAFVRALKDDAALLGIGFVNVFKINESPEERLAALRQTRLLSEFLGVHVDAIQAIEGGESFDLRGEYADVY